MTEGIKKFRPVQLKSVQFYNHFSCHTNMVNIKKLQK